MRLLLDTHAFLWFVFDDPRLSEHAAEVIGDPSNETALSIASLWEIAIKCSLGKLELGVSLERFIATQVDGRKLRVLSIAKGHVVRVASLPFHHRDPFDRLLVAQALADDLTIVTTDEHFARYGVTTSW